MEGRVLQGLLTTAEIFAVFDIVDRIASPTIQQCIEAATRVCGGRRNRKSIAPLRAVAFALLNQEARLKAGDELDLDDAGSLEELRERVGYGVSQTWVRNKIEIFVRWRYRNRSDNNSDIARISLLLNLMWVPELNDIPADLFAGEGFHTRRLGSDELHWQETTGVKSGRRGSRSVPVIQRLWHSDDEFEWLLSHLPDAESWGRREDLARTFTRIHNDAREYLTAAAIHRREDAAGAGSIDVYGFQDEIRQSGPPGQLNDIQEHALFLISEPRRLQDEIGQFRRDIETASRQAQDGDPS